MPYNSICFPAFPKGTPKALILFSTISIGLSALLFPPHTDYWIFSKALTFFRLIKDVSALSDASQFPDAAAFSYGLALYSSTMVAVVSFFSEINTSPLKEYQTKTPAFTRLITCALALIATLSPYLFYAEVGEEKRSFAFFQMVSSNRIFLLLWIEGIFFLNYFFLFIFGYEAISLSKNAIRRARNVN